MFAFNFTVVACWFRCILVVFLWTWACLCLYCWFGRISKSTWNGCQAMSCNERKQDRRIRRHSELPSASVACFVDGFVRRVQIRTASMTLQDRPANLVAFPTGTLRLNRSLWLAYLVAPTRRPWVHAFLLRRKSPNLTHVPVLCQNAALLAHVPHSALKSTSHLACCWILRWF